MKKLAVVAAVAMLAGLAAIPVAGASSPTQVATRTVAKALNVPRPGTRLTIPARLHGQRVTRVQWLRCNRIAFACRRIVGATGRVYVVRLADVGHTLRAHVWEGSAQATTSPTSQIGRPLPVNTALPTITDGGQGGGSLSGPIVGDVLTGSNGTWQHAVRFTYQWQDCTTASPPVCTPILGATTAAYTLQDSDVGSTIVFVVTAYNF